MAWIEMHTTLRNHPKVLFLATSLAIEKAQAVGHLACLWTWCLEYAEDGDISKYSEAIIEGACEWKGRTGELFRQLKGSWIDEDLKIHDWLDYVGQYLIKKYHSSDPNKLKTIWARYGYAYGKGYGKGMKIKINPRKNKGRTKEDIPNLNLTNLTLTNKESLTPSALPSEEEINEASETKIEQLIMQEADHLYQEKIFPKAHAFINFLKKKDKNLRAILQTLCQIYSYRPKDPWAYGIKIMGIEDGNFNERDYRKSS